MDLLLCAKQAVAQGGHAVSALASALRSHQLNPSSFMSSVKRVLQLRASLGT
jgi:hypothetical protein